MAQSNLLPFIMQVTAKTVIIEAGLEVKQTIMKYKVFMETLEDQLYSKPARSSQGQCFCNLLANTHKNHPGNSCNDWSALETQEEDLGAKVPLIEYCSPNSYSPYLPVLTLKNNDHV